MDLGLYNLKYPFRKGLEWLLPYFKETDPNQVSLSLIPLGIVTGLVYFSADGDSWLYLIGIFLIFLRMVIGTLDGLIAVTYHKSTPKGEMINRIAPEVADFFLMLGVIFSIPGSLILGAFALVLAWATSFFGLVGLVAGKPTQSVGPVGQTDRLVALMIASFLQFLFGISTDWITFFLWWCIIGGMITVSIRAFRLFANEIG